MVDQQLGIDTRYSVAQKNIFAMYIIILLPYLQYINNIFCKYISSLFELDKDISRLGMNIVFELGRDSN